MSRDIPESDWRQFRKVHAALLDRHCQRTLNDLSAIARSTEDTAHTRYRKCYDLLMERDDEIARAFDDVRRSTAVMQLMIMRRMKLLTDDDLKEFSEPTRERIRASVSF